MPVQLELFRPKIILHIGLGDEAWYIVTADPRLLADSTIP
jgi:hypothetical protein